ncbi:MAG: hydroxyacylglutathione hydrolase [Methylophilaceae bacterium]
MIDAMHHDNQIIPIPAFEDNYIWLIHNGSQAIIVDPGDAAPVISTLKGLNLTLNTILITHHHHDHIDGVAGLLATYPKTHVYAPKLDHYAFAHTSCSEPDVIYLTAFNITFNVLNCAGHTAGHIAYFAKLENEEYWLFSGDVIFAVGCGFVPEGSFEQAYQTLQKIAALPLQTKVFCTHEYTLANIHFALSLEPNNQDLCQRLRDTQMIRAKNQVSLPTTIGLELATNPFLRCGCSTILKSINSKTSNSLSNFTAVRKLKNTYKSNI